MTSTSTNKVAHNIKEAFEQVSADNYRYSPDTHRDGRVVILSKWHIKLYLEDIEKLSHWDM